jgi:hypothetical protein
VRQSSFGSIRVLRAGQVKDGLEQDVEIGNHRPLGDVVHVVFDAVDKVVLDIHGAAVAVHLGPTGDAGLHAMAAGIMRHDLMAQLLSRPHGDRVRTGADHGHLTTDHIQELRQLIQAGLAQELSDTGDAGIVAARLLSAPIVEPVDTHRAELKHLDLTVG